MANVIKIWRDANNGGYAVVLFDQNITSTGGNGFTFTINGNDFLDVAAASGPLLILHYSDDLSLFDGAAAYSWSGIDGENDLSFDDSSTWGGGSGNTVPLVRATGVTQIDGTSFRVATNAAITDTADPFTGQTLDANVADATYGIRDNDQSATLVDGSVGHAYVDLSYSSVTVGDPATFLNVGGANCWGSDFGPLQAFTLTVAAGSTNYTLTAETGSFSLTGNAAGMIAVRKLAAGAGNFALTGNPAGMKAALSLVASPGSFLLTGGDAEFTVTSPSPPPVVVPGMGGGGSSWAGSQFYRGMKNLGNEPKPAKKKKSRREIIIGQDEELLVAGVL